jgi:FtsP/CotA-like multicopper oxidase with cupredoxin domain
MRPTRLLIIPLLMIFMLIVGIMPAGAGIFVQCPGDTNGDLIPDQPGYENVVCKHITGGDGFVKMADGTDTYIFSFGEVDHTDPDFNLASVVTDYTLKAMAPAPRIELDEGQELYLTLTNVGMIMRPDLFDPHSVHWHGFPNAAPIFDGLPEPSTTPIMGGSVTYYYSAAVPGTYFYHCHVEAAEHMQMGMIGNLWVNPAQNGNTAFYSSGLYAYNDEDGSTGYDVAYPVQLTGFDSNFHQAHINVQPLPFADMYDDYPMINGRGYPDTINTSAAAIVNQDGFKAQAVHSLITADSGQRILLRLSNVSTTHLYTVATTLGVPMKVVGRGAALLKGPTGLDTSYEVSVLNVGGGQAFDVIVDTTGVPSGTYFLYTTNLANLSNGNEERGGIMTEIAIN